ncbi:MAG: haloacid dehalogenase-like hydrolase [Candidatus Methylacidiphilales bacterium]|nr:haloacid dehalogenase-like hydrolase [Candidatus Methylacidiphilales bacterium]
MTPPNSSPNTATATKLLLWDIDGTLIWSGRAGEDALLAAMKELHGIETSLQDVDYKGRTDRRIGMMLMEKHHISLTDESLHDFVECYLKHLARLLPEKTGWVYRGVLDILEEAHRRPDLVNALLTGNMRRGAELKLAHYNVWHYFEFGAFADDSHDRNQLGPVALQRALEEQKLDITPGRVFVIGDTPHDVACGKVIGAKTIAVATGGFTADELRDCGPSAVFEDFSHPEAFFHLIDRL